MRWHLIPSLFLLLAVVLAPICTTLSQEKETYGSLGADVVVPLGNLKTQVFAGYGGSAKIDFHVSPRIALTASVGFVSFEGKSDSMASFRGVPLLGGMKCFLLHGTTLRIYCAGEAGAFIWTNKQAKSVGFSVAPILGFEFPMEMITNLDVSVRYDYLDFSRRERVGLGLRAAVSFEL